MERHEVLALSLKIIWLVFTLAFGACVGSLINVLVYRLPRGLGVVLPSSKCPSCDTKLSWRDNIPIFGWLVLRGRCRYCKTPISPEYPIVESVMALLFGIFFVAFMLDPQGRMFPDLPLGALAPEWAHNPPAIIWPTFVLILLLVGSLAAMTLIDARTFMIPMELTIVPVVLAVLIHPVHAAWIELGTALHRLPETAPGWAWSIATPTEPETARWWVGACGGAVLGLVVSALLARFKLIRRSFEDYEAWEKHAIAQAEAKADAEGKVLDNDDNPTALWIQYPHARREMFKEIVYLAPALGLGTAGSWLAHEYLPPDSLPLWLTVLTGVVMGYLIGGGVVWAVRILGSLAFGKEAMGLGDVHLMAAVGACVGWIDTVLAFFLAAFVGMAWQVIAVIAGGKMSRAMPYGPYLAVATVLVILFKPAVEWGCTLIMGMPCNIP